MPGSVTWNDLAVAGSETESGVMESYYFFCIFRKIINLKILINQFRTILTVNLVCTGGGSNYFSEVYLYV